MSMISDNIKQTLAYPSLLMGGVALLVCTLLMLTNNVTELPIKQRLREDLTKQMDKVLPSSAYDNQPLDEKFERELDGKTYTFYRARIEGKVSAIIIFTSEAGYSGDINMLIAINADGSLSGVRVLSHTETPGLGDKIEEARDPWILGFSGLSLNNPDSTGWAVKKDGGQFDAFTGATITPRAVVKGVYEILQLFKKHQSLFLETTEVPAEPLAQPASADSGTQSSPQE